MSGTSADVSGTSADVSGEFADVSGEFADMEELPQSGNSFRSLRVAQTPYQAWNSADMSVICESIARIANACRLLRDFKCLIWMCSILTVSLLEI
jgi:hypothetical protein